MRRYSIIAVLVTTLVSIGFIGCGIPQEKYDADMKNLQRLVDETANAKESLEDQFAKLKADREALEAELAELQSQLQRLTDERDANAAEIEKARKRIAMFKDMLLRFKELMDAGKIKIKIVNNKMVVEMASAILFPSGSAKLSKEGKKALSDVAEILATIEERSFQVAGHTDNKPISNSSFESNWELSAARAVAVTEHLIKNGMTAENLSAAGYADTQPVASNETASGRAENRRIEIVLQPNLDELPDLTALEKMVD
ncbi:MAG: OmpA family protein [Deltaproteobacteria bacterium]|nr:OmpA family protein [Deltaproteobacteria bacterium]MBN2673076.1 OmpA family protein [Deltaproteobacteria bacterium]